MLGNKIGIKSREKISNTLKNFFKTESGILLRKKISNFNSNRKQTKESNLKRSIALKGIKREKGRTNPNAHYWDFYDRNNKLIIQTLGNRTQTLKNLKSNQKRIVIFYDLNECLNYNLEDKKDYKLYTRKYYEKSI